MDSHNHDWSDLMMRCQSGDPISYRILLHRLHSYIHSVLSRELKQRNHIDDLIQEVLLSVHKARFTYDPSKPFKPWLHAIIRYRMIDSIRILRTSSRLEVLYDFLPEAEVPQHRCSEDEEKLQNLKLALNKLSGKQRKVVELLKLDGLSIKEVARQCEMSESAVKVTAHRAYAQLRIRMERERHES